MLNSGRQPGYQTVVLALALAGALPANARAQSERPPRSADAAAKASTSGDAVISGVSLDRIRRQLRETPPPREPSSPSPFKLEYYVEVVGTPPRIDFFKDFHIGNSSVPTYGPMTHSEFLRITAPPWRRTWW